MKIRALSAVLAATAGAPACCFTAVNESMPTADAGIPDSGSRPDAGPPPPDAGPPTACVIDGFKFSEGVLNPDSVCQSCQAAVDPLHWSNLGYSEYCDARFRFCFEGACVDGCRTDDGGYAILGTTIEGGCTRCVPTQRLSVWTPLFDGTACAGGAPGSICFSGSCRVGCLIGGKLREPDALDDADGCRSCQPLTSTADWTNRPDGTACRVSGSCHQGLCTQVAPFCTIAGTTYLRGLAKPDDPSKCCSPARNAAAWTYRLQDGGSYDISYPDSIAAADFNGDGRMDLAMISDGTVSARNVRVLLGRPDGTLGPPTLYAVDNCVGMAAGDVNGDGFPDLVLPACSGTGDNEYLLINNADGTGTFSVSSQAPPLGWDWAFPLVDLDGDGILDLALTDNTDVLFLRGIGDGTFATPVAYPIVGPNGLATSVAAGDFRGIGILDLVTGNGFDQTLSLLLGDGKGSFTVQRTLFSGLPPESVSVGDFDGDGKLDIAAGGNGPPQILLGNGDGTFRPRMSLVDAGRGWTTLADLDGDGTAELILADLDGDHAFSIFWYSPDGGPTRTLQPLSPGASMVFTPDMNGDGVPDVVTIQPGVTVYINGCP